jgi:serine/threonine protein kinase/Tfp pilus assembly protein PilF
MINGTISHYRIIEELGAGGMGKVFKAEDLLLGRMVALKFISDSLARDHDALKRFQREARAASSLNHPHICTIHEIGEFEGRPFIVMELLEGEPLSTLIRKAPLSLPEVIDFATQITDGLQSAHDKGVVHRDLKPSNIFISNRRTAKILDFGLAKLSTKPQADVSADTPTESVGTWELSLGHPGLPVGTLGYMSPEQIRGEPTDGRADLFALGITLYEMSTGQPPFRGSSVAVVLAAILHETPPAPSVHNPILPREFDRIVAKALEKDRNARYQSASEVAIDLFALRRRLEAGRKPRARNLLLGTIAAAILLSLGIAFLAPRLRRSAIRAPTVNESVVPHQRRSLAVLGFRNLTKRPDIDWLSVALSEMLSTELAAGDQLRIIPGENVSLANVGFSSRSADSFKQTTPTRLKERLGTDLVVFGSYVELGSESGNQLRLDVRLEDTGRGETIAALSETGTEANLFQLVTHIGSLLREKLGTGGVPASEIEGVRASLPAHPEVMRLYAEGLASLRAIDFQAAQNALSKVVSAQPDYAPAHSALSRAYSALGYDEKAAREAKRAYDLSQGFSRQDRLEIEARYRESVHDRERAIEIYGSLWKSFPDDVEYGIQLARVQISAGKGRDALETVKRLRTMPSPSRDDSRIDLAQAAALESLGEFDQALRSVERVLSSQQESPLILADAYAKQGWALYRTGRSPEALAALSHARKLFTDSGQKQGTARVIQTTGDIVYSSGDFAKARKLHEQALAIYREIADQSGIANALNDIANTLYTNGNFSEAKPLYQQSLEIYRAVGSAAGLAGALGNLANVLDDEGDLEGAARMQEQTLAAFRQIGDARGASATLTNIGNLLLERGDLAEARKLQEQALAERRKINFKSGAAYSLQGLGEVLLAQGDLHGARKNFEQAAAVRRELGEHGALATTQVDLAELSIHEGDFQTGEQTARAAASEFQKRNDPENEAIATAVLARALLAGNKLAEAQNAVNRTRSILPPAATYPSRFLVGIVSARVRAAAGETSEAAEGLRELIELARRHGYLGYEFEARLALGEIQSKTGQKHTAEAVLSELEKDANSRGFALIVRRTRSIR